MKRTQNHKGKDIYNITVKMCNGDEYQVSGTKEEMDKLEKHIDRQYGCDATCFRLTIIGNRVEVAKLHVSAIEYDW